MVAFVDASFLLALFNRDDEFHQKARKTIRELDAFQTRFFTSNIALGETINLTFRHKGAKTAKKLLKMFQKNAIEEIFVDREIFARGYRFLFSQKLKRGLNFLDCLHLATMKVLGIDTILTYDEGFKKYVKVIG